MKRTIVFFFAFVLLVMTADRLPAPIQEVPPSPTQTPSAAPAAEPRKSQPKPKSKPTGAARFAGTWIGRIKAGLMGDVRCYARYQRGRDISGADLESRGLDPAVNLRWQTTLVGNRADQQNRVDAHAQSGRAKRRGHAELVCSSAHGDFQTSAVHQGSATHTMPVAQAVMAVNASNNPFDF
jgi:hypothetical protein